MAREALTGRSVAASTLLKVVLRTVIAKLYSLTKAIVGATTRKYSLHTASVLVFTKPGSVLNVAEVSSGQWRAPVVGSIGQNSYGSIRQIWMLLYELSASKANWGIVPAPLRHQLLNAVYMASEGFVIQNAYLSVATAGILAHGVLSKE